MMHLNETWVLKGRKGDARGLAEHIGISRRLASLLILKLQSYCMPRSEYSDPIACAEAEKLLADAAREFLAPDISLLYDEMSLKDMDKALDIIEAAAAEQKKVLIIGDYDVDGIMGLLILCDVMNRIFKDVSYYIPHRIDDGYGINEKIVCEARDNGVQLIITCDNGMSAYDAIGYAKSLGMDVIVTDHHSLPDADTCVDSGCGLPPADAIINPKRTDCTYPFKDLCGTVVAYKLANAIAKRIGIELRDWERDEMMCYAAIATICDIVELIDENRRIVHHGLKILNTSVKNPGLSELINVCGLAGKHLTTYEVGHIIGPCINAAGRLDTAELSYGLFIEKDPKKLHAIASEILDLNRKRQELTSLAYEKALFEIEGEAAPAPAPAESILIKYMPDTHESICGIVAGKLKDKFARPAIVLTVTPSGLLKGSGRSVEGFDLLRCVKTAENLLDKFGGHKMAVGVSIKSENLAQFREILNQKCDIDSEMLTPKERIDLCLEPEDITIELGEELERLEPFGRGNEKPVFAMRGVALEYASLIGIKRNVIKMKLRKSTPRANERISSYAMPLIDAVFFGDVNIFLKKLELTAGADDVLVCRGAPAIDLDITFYLEINEYNGTRKVQLIVRSVRKAV